MNRKIQWVMPVVILIAAAGVSWWSAKQEGAIEQHVRNEVIQLIPLVTVTTGDDPNYGDGSATHVALVDLDNLPTVGLRILCSGADEPMFMQEFGRSEGMG